MFGWGIPTYLYILIQVPILAGCAVLSGWRFARSPAGILAPIGFGLLTLHRLASTAFMFRSFQFMHYGFGSGLLLWFVDFAGWGCILAAIATVKVAPRDYYPAYVPTVDQAPEPEPPSTDQPAT